MLQRIDALYDPATGGWRMPQRLNQPVSDVLARHWRRTQEPNYGNVEREVAHMFRAMVHMLGIQNALETGTHNGYSAAHIAAAMEERGIGQLTTIDLDPGFHIFSHTPGGNRVKFVHGNSVTVPLPEGAPYDALFLDSDHHAHTILGELNRFAPLLKVGGTMFLHDAMHFDGVAVVVNALKARPEFEVVVLPTPRTHGAASRPPGMAIVRKKEEVQPGFLEIDPALTNLEVNLEGRTWTDPPLS